MPATGIKPDPGLLFDWSAAEDPSNDRKSRLNPFRSPRPARASHDQTNQETWQDITRREKSTWRLAAVQADLGTSDKLGSKRYSEKDTSKLQIADVDHSWHLHKEDIMSFKPFCVLWT
jgi:hypothetical protein